MGFFQSETSTSLPDAGPSPNYLFAYESLREVALDDPIKFLDGVTGSKVARYLPTLFRHHRARRRTPPDFGPRDLVVHTTRVQDYPCVMVEFPKPERLAEPHFIAVVVMVKLSVGVVADPSRIEARVFSLEKCITLTNQPRTVLGTWQNGEYHVLGDGPVPTVEAFVASISRFF